MLLAELTINVDEKWLMGAAGTLAAAIPVASRLITKIVVDYLSSREKDWKEQIALVAKRGEEASEDYKELVKQLFAVQKEAAVAQTEVAKVMADVLNEVRNNRRNA